MKFTTLTFTSMLLWSLAQGAAIDDGLRRDPNIELLTIVDGIGERAIPEPELCCSPPPTVYRKCCAASCGACTSYSCDVCPVNGCMS